MKQSPSKANFVSQESPCILRNPKIHYRVHRSLLLVPILSQLNPVRAITSYLFDTHFNQSLLLANQCT